MLRTVLTLLIGLGSAASQKNAPHQPSSAGNSQQSDYQTYSSGGQYGGGYDNNIIEEIRKLYNNITTLQLEDDELIHILNPMLDESEPSNVLMETFFSQLYPEVRERQKAQTQEIHNLEDQARDLLGLADDIAEVTNSISQSDYQLKDIATQSKKIQETVSQLQKGDTDIDKKLEAVKYLLADQESKLKTIESYMSKDNGRLSYLREQIETIHEIVLDEREGGSFSITLTNESPIASKAVAYNGKKAPVAQYGVSALHVVNDKESIIVPYSDYAGNSYGKTPAKVPVEISYDLDAYYDPGSKQLTATMFDHSTGGWYISEIVVSILFFNIDDRILYIEK